MRYKITWFLLCFPIFLWAQEKQWILTNELGNPISHAAVFYLQGDVGKTVSTDSNGVFYLPQNVSECSVSFLGIQQTIRFHAESEGVFFRNDTIFSKKFAVYLRHT